MPYNILIVDDSAFYRRRLAEFIMQDPMLRVVGQAKNGQEAIELTASLRPDAITMDVEMPVKNGIQAVKEIMASSPTPILMFSSLTKEGAKITLDALEAGAVDYIAKNLDDFSQNREQAIRNFNQKLKNIARNPLTHKTKPIMSGAPSAAPIKINYSPSQERATELLVIGASTGGPVALQQIVSALPSNFPVPIVIVQHMPFTFTGTFAERLNSLSQLDVHLASNGEQLLPGHVYLAPGDHQLKIAGSKLAPTTIIASADSHAQLNYHPSIDYTLMSLHDSLAAKTLVMILTGMGADGSKGSQYLKQRGAQIWAQDEQTSVVYGMPKAVAETGCCDKVLAIDKVAPQLCNYVMGKA